MVKILITGATGFIGNHLIQHLLQKNVTIRALIRDTKKSTNLPKEIEIVEGDLTNADSLHGICTGIETVYHLAGYAHAWADNNPAFTNQHNSINLQGSKNILNEAIRSNVKKFIFFSSVKAVRDSEQCIDEQYISPPNSPYGIAKREAEKWILDTAKTHKIHACILRPSLVYGPAWKGNLDSMLRSIDRGYFPPLPETHNRRSLISVTDICHAALLAADNPKANGQIYFVTDGQYYSTRELYVLMRQALGKQVPRWHVPLWFFKVLASIGDIGKKMTGRRLPFNSDAMSKLFGSAQYDSQAIQRDLGFKPNYDLQKMLPDIIAAYRNQLT